MKKTRKRSSGLVHAPQPSRAGITTTPEPQTNTRQYVQTSVKPYFTTSHNTELSTFASTDKSHLTSTQTIFTNTDTKTSEYYTPLTQSSSFRSSAEYLSSRTQDSTKSSTDNPSISTPYSTENAYFSTIGSTEHTRTVTGNITSNGAVIWGLVGGIVAFGLLIIILGLIFFYLKIRRSSQSCNRKIKDISLHRTEGEEDTHNKNTGSNAVCEYECIKNIPTQDAYAKLGRLGKDDIYAVPFGNRMVDTSPKITSTNIELKHIYESVNPNDSRSRGAYLSETSLSDTCAHQAQIDPTVENDDGYLVLEATSGLSRDKCAGLQTEINTDDTYFVLQQDSNQTGSLDERVALQKEGKSIALSDNYFVVAPTELTSNEAGTDGLENNYFALEPTTEVHYEDIPYELQEPTNEITSQKHMSIDNVSTAAIIDESDETRKRRVDKAGFTIDTDNYDHCPNVTMDGDYDVLHAKVLTYDGDYDCMVDLK